MARSFLKMRLAFSIWNPIALGLQWAWNCRGWEGEELERREREEERDAHMKKEKDSLFSFQRPILDRFVSAFGLI
jgi:hypothetical protein